VRKVFILSRFPALLILMCVSIFACKTVKVVSDFKAKPMSTDRIIKKIEENAFNYKYFSIKRINCQYQDGDNKASFRANLKTIKDEAIVLYFSKLNISVGRILLTPDSIKYVNFLDKNYFIGDYGFLSEIFNIDLDFDDVQSILSNDIFSYRNVSGKNQFRNFTSYIDSGRYVLQSTKVRKINRIVQKDKPQRVERILKRLEDEALIIQTIIVRPDNFNIEKIRIEDKSNNQAVEFEFDDYTGLENKDYPGTINMSFLSEGKNISMKIRLGGFSTETVDNFGFNIPAKYIQKEIN
jgi:hypothetical protein